jgi:hypothetical protein
MRVQESFTWHKCDGCSACCRKRTTTCWQTSGMGTDQLLVCLIASTSIADST